MNCLHISILLDPILFICCLVLIVVSIFDDWQRINKDKD